MIQAIDNVVNAVSGILYKPYVVPLLLVLAGIWFTVKTGLLQFRLFGESIRVIKEKPVGLGSTSSFGVSFHGVFLRYSSYRFPYRCRLPFRQGRSSPR